MIDHTEALISIDINSARATKGQDIEATALATNLEAAEEIARQCRIRDLGGLLVIDFIDMGPNKNQRDVENRLREAVKTDRARVQIGRISRFGLLEMSRQRLRRSLGESAHQVCPRCNGSGSIRGVESLGLAILRLIGEEARKERTSKVIAELPVDVATFLLNEKREMIQNVEQRTDVQLLLVTNPALETPNYTIRRVRDDQTLMPENSGASYELSTPEGDVLEDAVKMTSKHDVEVAAVSAVTPASPAPAPTPAATPDKPVITGGLLGWLKRLLIGDPTADSQREKPRGKGIRKRAERSGGQQNRNRNRRGRGGNRRTEDKQQREARGSNSRKRNQNKPKSQSKAKQESSKQTESADSGESRGSQGTGRKRRRRRRSSRSNQDKPQNQSAAQDQQAEAPDKPAEAKNQSNGGKPRNKETPEAISGEVKAAEPKQPESTKQAKSEAPGTEPTSQGKSDGDRLLPWETAKPEPSKTYTVWSSDSEGNK